MRLVADFNVIVETIFRGQGIIGILGLLESYPARLPRDGVRCITQCLAEFDVFATSTDCLPYESDVS